jgi:hypothetical protein
LERALLIGPKSAGVNLILKPYDSEFLFLAYEDGQSPQEESFKCVIPEWHRFV